MMGLQELAKQLLEKLQEENSNLVDNYFDFERWGDEDTMLLFIALRKYLE